VRRVSTWSFATSAAGVFGAVSRCFFIYFIFIFALPACSTGATEVKEMNDYGKGNRYGQLVPHDFAKYPSVPYISLCRMWE
jgi:hypothetical protein